MKEITYTHKELYGMDGSLFVDDLPFINKRIDILKANFQRLVHHTEAPKDKEGYSKHQQRIRAVNKAIDFWRELKEDIVKEYQ